MTGLTNEEKLKRCKAESKYLAIVLIIFVFALLITISGYYGLKNNAPEIIPPTIIERPPIIFIDESARTGFLKSESIMARFECVEFSIAGSDEKDIVFLIDVYLYPEISIPVSYRVDSFEEACGFLEGLR